MAPEEKDPFFSFIISTRDRPGQFEVALRSVQRQTFVQKEVIAVIDGSTDANMACYAELEQQYNDVTFLRLVHRPNGHGHSYAMNFGAHNSRGRYLCFLDDDDEWTDDHYLDHVFSGISASSRPADMHYSNQRAVHSNGVMQTEDVWLDALVPKASQRLRNTEDSYFVDAAFLLSGGGFAHLNCSIFERHFYASIGGMDESIRYEEDRDIFIRSIDTARVMLYSTRYSSLHHIPDSNATNNLSTASSAVQKKLYQMYVYDKGISRCRQDVVVRFCCRGKTCEMKHTATMLAAQKRYTGAAQYARAALLNGFNPRWLAFTLYLTAKAWFTRRDAATEDPR